MPIQPGDIVRVTAKMELDTGDDVQNVYHFKHDGVAAVAEATFMDGVDTYLDDAYTEINSHLSTALGYQSIDAVNVTQDVNVGEVAWPVLVEGGTSATETYAMNTAALVNFLTDTLRSQGRKYIGGFVEGSIDGKGALGTAFQTALAAYAADILAGFTVAGEDFIPGNWNPTLIRFVEWTTAVVADLLANQRRRKLGIGS